MRKVFLMICGVVLNWSVFAYAQIDLGVDDLSDVSVKEDIPNKDKTKGFSFFDNALKILSSSQSANLVQKDINIEELKTKASNGSVEAQLDLGYIYLYGANDIAVDYKQALYYYEMAAQKKSAAALNNLGSLYFNGIGTDVDYAKALSYFEEAASLGSDDAAVNLAIIYLGSDVKNKSMEKLEKVIPLLTQAEPNNNIAKYLLGYCYMQGFLLKQDYSKAFQLIKTAADSQYDEAELVLADFYINGWGTPKNYNRAVQYLNRAAAQGNAEALFKLGDIYAEGKIYKRDIKKAHIQYNIASFLGIKEAASKRDALENNIRIEDLLSVQSDAEDYAPAPSDQTSFIRKTYGDSLKAYIDFNAKNIKKLKKTGE